jgi:hypothetical protein
VASGEVKGVTPLRNYYDRWLHYNSCVKDGLQICNLTQIVNCQSCQDKHITYNWLYHYIEQTCKSWMGKL